MKITFKNSLITAFSTVATLSITSPVFAQTSLNPCERMTAPWNNLCRVSVNNIGPTLGSLILILFIIAALIALIFLIWGGIKWILSGGDKAKVETARSTIIAAVIGLIVTFLAFFILQIVLGIFGIDLTNLRIPRLLG